MRTMTAAEFKAKCLKVMDEVAASGTAVVVTKRGKPVARLVPEPAAERPRRPERLRDLFKGMIEVADPADGLTRPALTREDWEAIDDRLVAKFEADRKKGR
jgi:prevent-host-death family protein